MTSGIQGLVRLDQVSKRYGDSVALDGVSLEIIPGSHLALLGPSGCGKSTAIRLIAGLEPPDGGTVHVSGRLASSAGHVIVPPHLRGLSVVFQDLGLWPNLTVIDNVLLGLAGTGLSGKDRRERAREALANCRIERLADRRPAGLSGGEQQRAALARAVAVRPQLLLLDEPFAGLDLGLKRHLYEEIRHLAKTFDATCLLVSHDPMEATAFCSDAAVLEAGRLRERGRLEALLASPTSCTLREFVDQLPRRSD
jgi:ABC-type Fe3+/spermidine/putrescine transport system ATPase subunit